MIKDEIIKLINEAVISAQRKGDLPELGVLDISLDHPQNPAHGDYATSLALKLARPARMSPMSIAEILKDYISEVDYIARVEVAQPGFINFVLSDQWLKKQVNKIILAGDNYGNLNLGGGKKVQIEFGSANPTGPLTAATGRGGALGDSLARVLSAAGYDVFKEYYVNDAGSRMDAFFESVYARYLQQFDIPAEIPFDGYQGSYVIDLAKELKKYFGKDILTLSPKESMALLGRKALQMMVDSAKSDLNAMGIEFDEWFSEQKLFDEGIVNQVVNILAELGHTIIRDGATWLTSSTLGEDKDNVLIRSNGVPTYFASDIAYHYEKFNKRGFDWVIDIWGADHQGHVPRMKAAIGAIGIDPDRLTLLIHQMITLRRGDEIVRMSKRTGDLITLREVIEEVGKDASRFFFLSRSADSHIDFDVELAKSQSMDNPVYYVQYAYARINSILRNAADIDFNNPNLDLLSEEFELSLIRKSLELPEVVEMAAKRLEPHHLTYYAQDWAAIFHSFYNRCRVISDNKELTKARLALVMAAKIVLKKNLYLMGVDAPEQM